MKCYLHASIIYNGEKTYPLGTDYESVVELKTLRGIENRALKYYQNKKDVNGYSFHDVKIENKKGQLIEIIKL